MNKEELKKQLLEKTDVIIGIILKDKSVEIKNGKDGITVFEVTKKIK